MPMCRVTRRPCGKARVESQRHPGPGHRRPAEIARQSGVVQHDFDDVGIEQLVRVPDRVAGRGHGRFGRIREQGRHCAIRPGSIIGSSPWTLTTRLSAASPSAPRPPRSGQCPFAWSPRVITARWPYRSTAAAMSPWSVATYTSRAAAFARPLGYAHDHGPASNIGERLSRKPGGRESRRDNGGEDM